MKPESSSTAMIAALPPRECPMATARPASTTAAPGKSLTRPMAKAPRAPRIAAATSR